jgi:CTP-dependent riboflavin kinase
VVVSGIGEAAKFVELPWVRRQLRNVAGLQLYPGTLNIRLIGSSMKTRSRLDERRGKLIEAVSGYHRGVCFNARLMGVVDCAVIIPLIPDYPDDVLEIVAAVNLRDSFNLHDSDYVTLEVFLD